MSLREYGTWLLISVFCIGVSAVLMLLMLAHLFWSSRFYFKVFTEGLVIPWLVFMMLGSVAICIAALLSVKKRILNSFEED